MNFLGFEGFEINSKEKIVKSDRKFEARCFCLLSVLEILRLDSGHNFTLANIGIFGQKLSIIRKQTLKLRKRVKKFVKFEEVKSLNLFDLIKS